LCEILNPHNKPGRLTLITRMGAENMRVKLPHMIRAVRQAGMIVTWVSDPMHGNTISAPCGLKTRSFDAIRVRTGLVLSFGNILTVCSFIPLGTCMCRLSSGLSLMFMSKREATPEVFTWR